MKKLLKTILLISLCFLIFTGADCTTGDEYVKDNMSTFTPEIEGYKLISSSDKIVFQKGQYDSSNCGIVEYNGESYSWLTTDDYCLYTKKGTDSIVLDRDENGDLIDAEILSINKNYVLEQSAVIKSLYDDGLSVSIKGVLEFDGRLFLFVIAQIYVSGIIPGYWDYLPPMIFEYDIVNGTIKFANYFEEYDDREEHLYKTCVVRTN